MPAFAGELFGPGQPLDASRFFIIIPDAIGTGGSAKPSEGMRAKFSEYNYADMVAAQYRLVTLREANFVWDASHLHDFLTFPIMNFPGTKMGFAGMFDENDRSDVIAFLKAERAADSPMCQPGADPAPPPGTNTGELGGPVPAPAHIPRSDRAGKSPS